MKRKGKDSAPAETENKSGEGGELRGRGRPPVHGEEWAKVTVVLYNRQVVFLDHLALEIRAKTGTVIKRAEIIRALIDALDESGIDLREATSEEEMKALLLRRFAGEVKG